MLETIKFMERTASRSNLSNLFNQKKGKSVGNTKGIAVVI